MDGINKALMVCVLIANHLICSVYAQQGKHFVLHSKKENILIVSGITLTMSGLLLQQNVASLTTAEVMSLNRRDVNKFDRNATKEYHTNASTTSDRFLYGSYLLPLLFLTNRYARKNGSEIGVMLAEVVLINSGITSLTKSLSLRTRPYAYNPEVPLKEKLKNKTRYSFYSGHASTAASISFFSAKVLSSYIVDQKGLKIAIWTAAASLPALVGFWRYESGNHFPSDIIIGYMSGALIGYLIPVLHKPKINSRISCSPIINQDQLMLNLSYTIK